MEILTNK